MYLMRGMVALAVLSCMVTLCAGSVWVRDHTGSTLAISPGSQQFTAEGIAATLGTLTGSTLLTIDSGAAAQVLALMQLLLPGIVCLLPLRQRSKSLCRCRPS